MVPESVTSRSISIFRNGVASGTAATMDGEAAAPRTADGVTVNSRAGKEKSRNVWRAEKCWKNRTMGVNGNMNRKQAGKLKNNEGERALELYRSVENFPCTRQGFQDRDILKRCDQRKQTDEERVMSEHKCKALTRRQGCQQTLAGLHAI